MRCIKIDVIQDILKSRLALHDFGIPVRKRLSDELGKVSTPTLFILSLVGANPMDYEFVNTSFSEIINAALTNENVFVTFKVDNSEFQELCTGIADIMGYLIKNEMSPSDTLIQNNFTLMYLNEENEPKYIMPFGELHKSILYDVMSQQTSSTKIQETFSMIAEEVSGILEDLLKSKFIVKVPGPEYIAISHYIN